MAVPQPQMTETRVAENDEPSELSELEQRLASEVHMRVRADFLSNATELLNKSLDFAQTLESICRLAVPAFADWCTVDLRAEGCDAQLRRVASFHYNLEKQPLLRELQTRYVPQLKNEHPLRKVFLQSDAIYVPQVEDRSFDRICTDPRHAELLRQLGFSSYIVVPLRGRGQVIGAISFLRGAAAPNYTIEDFSLASALGARASFAVGNATLYQQARKEVTARDEFLSIASHELRTPLTALQASVQYLRFRTHRDDPPPADELFTLLDLIEAQCKRMGRLTSDLLDMTRLQAGRLHLEFGRYQLEDIVNSAVAAVSEDARAAGVNIDVRACGTVPLECDSSRIEQVAINLLSNAIKYGNQKPVEIEVWPGTDGCGRLAVIDHGIGIPQELQGRIFDRFERVADPQRFNGLGLGLYIVKQIVEAHNGRIWLESKPGFGSKFMVELPLARNMNLHVH